jgi:uncharacterized protein (DUF2384 family)
MTGQKRTQLWRYQGILKRVTLAFRGSKGRAATWLATPQDALGGATPIDRMTRGEYDEVETLVCDLEGRRDGS